MSFEWLKKKLGQPGTHGLSRVPLPYSGRLDEEMAVNEISSTAPEAPLKKRDASNCSPHQLSAYRALSRYSSFNGKNILEIGGAQSCDSAYPFLIDGAASAIVTGLDHISEEKISSEYNLRVMRADALKLASIFKPNQFDVVYGLSVIEHIPTPKIFLDQVYSVLKPGGLAYFEGDPIWSSPKGHHLWIATWGGPYKDKTSANYLFSEWADAASTNPLPNWSHLLMTPSQMKEYLTEKSIPAQDIDCIIDWVYHSNEVNRIDMTKIAEAYTNSGLTVLEANCVRVDVPETTLANLRRQYGDGIDYGINGVTYVLSKPT